MTDITIHSIAGYCSEKALWKLLVDLSSEISESDYDDWKILMPDSVTLDGENFCIEKKSSSNPTIEFYPPEGIENFGESGFVWSLGAMVCYASSGHYVFGGRGGVYQRSHPLVELPTLKKEHFALSTIVKRCLCYSPSQRISLKELHAFAVKGLETNVQKIRTKNFNEPKGIISSVSPNDTWPEQMR